LDVDITEVFNLEEFFKGKEFRAVINCAAYTQVDEAETEQGQRDAFLINMRGPLALRRSFPGYVVHISTGFVFTGDRPMPYTEDDDPNPLSLYASSKWGGEIAVATVEPYLIVRTLDLFGENTPTDYVKGVLAQLERGEIVERPYTLHGNPTYIPSLARGILQAVALNVTGRLNLVGSTVINRFDFAHMIAKTWGYDVQSVQPTKEIRGAAPRPKMAILNVEKAQSLGIETLEVQDGLNRMKEALAANE
jgi:dTDP-4-dehydrorhamnose reductase